MNLDCRFKVHDLTCIHNVLNNYSIFEIFKDYCQSLGDTSIINLRASTARKLVKHGVCPIKHEKNKTRKR